MRKIYIAGAYSADNVIGVLDNMRRGMRAGAEILLAGFAPFCPWTDYHFQLMLREGEKLAVEDYYRYSLAWLEACDAVFVLPNSENSKGAQAEIKRAKELKMPVFHSIKKLKEARMATEIKIICRASDRKMLKKAIGQIAKACAETKVSCRISKLSCECDYSPRLKPGASTD